MYDNILNELRMIENTKIRSSCNQLNEFIIFHEKEWLFMKLVML